MRKSILLVGPRVNQVRTGVGVAFELLIEGLSASQNRVKIVNTQWGGVVKNSGSLNMSRVIVVVACVLNSWWKLPRCHTLYMPISTSKLGFIRDFLILRFASLLRVRTVVHLHGSGLKPFYEGSSPKFQKLMRQTFSRVDCFVILGELLKDQFSFASDWQKKTQVVLNGTPLDDSEIPPPTIKAAPAAGEKWRFLFLSNLMPTKGYIELVQACRILVDQGFSSFHLDFCGDFISTVVENDPRSIEQQKSDFLESINDPAIRDYVTYHGSVAGESKAEKLRNCHAFMLPTYHPWEGQPLSINEALAWATPVVTTRHRGIPEQVLDGVNGYYVEPKDPGSLAACLRRFLEGEVPYEHLSENARKHYESHFTNEQHIRSLIPLLVDR